jgi:hypothetical protein
MIESRRPEVERAGLIKLRQSFQRLAKIFGETRAEPGLQLDLARGARIIAGQSAARACRLR